MANIITIVRILCSIALLFCSVFSVEFYALYITAGISDILDGIIARKTHSAGEFGAKLDTVADMALFSVCFIKLLPAWKPEIWVCIWVSVIAAIKVINIVLGFVMYKKFVSIHSFMNKVAGAMLFVLPLALKFIDRRYAVSVVCSVATFAVVQECYFIKTEKDVNNE